MSEAKQRSPRTWVLWVVRVALALTVLHIGVVSISSIWMGSRTGSFWWVVYTMPPVSIGLLATLICWAPPSRPEGLELNVGMLIMFGLIPAVIFVKWLPLVIGALAILAMFVRPRGKLFIEASPPPAGWPRL